MEQNNFYRLNSSTTKTSSSHSQNRNLIFTGSCSGLNQSNLHDE